MTRKHKCYACNGSGALFPCEPSCHISALRHPWIVVEKCDSCDRFPDDLSAAMTYFRIAGWFLCTDSGEHALADARTRRVS